MTGTSGIPNVGIDAIMKRAYTATATETPPSLFGIGTGSTAFSAADTALEEPVPIRNTEAVDSCDTTAGWSAGTDSAVTLNTSSFIEGTGSLSLAKSGTSGTTASMSKTTPSLNFTAKRFCVFVKIVDLADLKSSGVALSIRFGSDSSNYYRYDVDVSALAAGWQFISFASGDAVVVGSPVITACDYTFVAVFTDLAADLIAADRILFDNMALASADDYFKAFESGFPYVDTALDQITIEGRLTSLEANGHLISESGNFNADSPKVLWSRTTITPFSKSLSDELIIQEIVRTTR